MRRKVAMRKKTNVTSPAGQSYLEQTEVVELDEELTKDSDSLKSSSQIKTKSRHLNQNTLNAGKSDSEAAVATCKETGNQKNVTKDCHIILEKCDDSTMNKGSEIGETSNVLLKNGEGNVKSVPKASNRDTKRKKDKMTVDDAKPSKLSRKEKEPDSSKSTPKKNQIPDVTSIDFSSESKTSDGNAWNFKISSWNINGVRAWLEKNGISFLHHEKPDILCIQETKCSDDKLPEEIKKVKDYYTYWLSGDKDGYSGVGLLSRKEPISIEYGIGMSEHDNEGRVITAEYEEFYLVAAYVPNAGRGLVRLDYRMKWDKDFCSYLKKLDAKKPVILCGDLNVAHKEIDLANPKTNKRNAGFTQEERDGFSYLLLQGFVDSFRHLYPDVTKAYTFWTYMMNARAKNVGWRLDYFVLSERLCEKLCDNVIRKDVFGSDHCPITLFLSL